MNLLTESKSNSKTSKNSAEYISALLHLSPFTTSGFNVCPMASEGCKKVCLAFAGRGLFNNVRSARIRKTQLFFNNRGEFMDLLTKDLDMLERRGYKHNKPVVVRLNGTSDLNWAPIVKKYDYIGFYDYTKIFKRLIQSRDYSNLHLTFSRTENNELDCFKALELGFNVAVVFRKELPEKYLGVPVINGDEHDLRFLDAKKVVVGLVAKGPAKKDNTGFVVDAT